MALRPPSARAAALVVLIALCVATPFGPMAIGAAGAADTSNPAQGPIPCGVADGAIARSDDSAALLACRRLIVPVAGVPRRSLRDSFRSVV